MNAGANFALGALCGLMIGGVGVLHVMRTNAEADTNRSVQQVTDSNTAFNKMQEASGLWEKRAESCEAKFRTGTIVYELAPAAPLVSIPMLKGMATVSVAIPQLQGSSTAQPSLWIPAEVKVYSNDRNVSFVWQDMQSGEIRRQQPALAPDQIGNSN